MHQTISKKIDDNQINRLLQELRHDVTPCISFEEDSDLRKCVNEFRLLDKRRLSDEGGSPSYKRRRVSPSPPPRRDPPPFDTRSLSLDSPYSMSVSNSRSSTPRQYERSVSFSDHAHVDQSGTYWEKRAEVLSDEATAIKRKADATKDKQIKSDCYVESVLKYLHSLHYREAAMEQFRKEENHAERHRIADFIKRTYDSTAKFIHQCTKQAGGNTSKSFLSVCEAVAHYRGFRMGQEGLNRNLNTWIAKIGSGERDITQDHKKTILEPLSKMMHCLHAWNIALATDTSMVPSGGFITLGAHELNSFWEQRTKNKS